MSSVVSPPAVVVADAPGPAPRPHRTLLVVATGLIVVMAAVGVWAATGSSAPGPLPSSLGITEDQPVAAAVLGIPLVDQDGRTTSLGAFRGKIVVLTSFLTSCQETCPLTTGAFLDMEHDLTVAGLADKVVFVEASVDPGRDVPSRLAAYAAVTGTNWPLLTGTAAHLKALWASFGTYYQKVAEGSPPGIDWQTGKPYTYDMNHSDGFIVLDRAVHERFVTGAAPNLEGHTLGRRLEGMLDAQGFRNLQHPGTGSWTIPEGLQAVGWLLGRTIPPAH